MYKWRPLEHALCALPLRFVFSVWKWGAKIPQKTRQIYLWATCESFENLLFHQFPVFGDIKEVWRKDWKMSLYKPGQVRACFCWIKEKFQMIHVKISFHDDHFFVDIFQRRKFCHLNFVYILDFFSFKFEHIWNYCGIIGIKIQISMACLGKKTFL